VAVDALLFPLDAIKTRVQAHKEDVRPTKSVYVGLASTMLGSFPSAAAFFTTYEFTKHYVGIHYQGKVPAWATHIFAASTAELVSCLIRVPFEVIKQQMQVGAHSSFRGAARTIYTQFGVAGLFRGYWTTVAREIPFDAFQFTIWEYLKAAYADDSGLVSPFYSAFFGSIGGGIAAAVTTPLDVAKTRLMTQGNNLRYAGMLHSMKSICVEEGVSKLFLGIVPRVAWISIGGFLFFGGYETCKLVLRNANVGDLSCGI